MQLHPDLESFLELVQMGDAPPMHLLSPTEARRSYDAATPMLDTPGEQSVRAEDLQLAGADGRRIGARLYSPRAMPPPGDGASLLPALLFFHGGGYCIGGLESHDALCRDLAHRTPCKVLAVDYRLSPEHTFPAAHDDALDAWNWLERQAGVHGIDPARLAAGGDSAGGTLATALCLRLKADGRAQPVLQMLLYPCTSSVQDSGSHRRYASGYLLEADTLQWMFGHHLNHESERCDWRFAPLLAPGLEGLAPAHIALAEFDPLLDEGRAYAARLREAEVPVALDVYPGMVHDFARLGNIVPEADRLRDDLARALASAFDARALAPALMQ
ncbi:esterase [Massilia sp. Root418]|uniref:alpha/beta hydrolase n=1 Tax=Massilia sp. Root418 TaxID=1736532 RepID=UPI0006FEC47B|nr:alpha/beta hydrolase [Massilia sp. Root418]KQW93455.1 esterase [Massilia sp. Root418]